MRKVSVQLWLKCRCCVDLYHSMIGYSLTSICLQSEYLLKMDDVKVEETAPWRVTSHLYKVCYNRGAGSERYCIQLS